MEPKLPKEGTFLPPLYQVAPKRYQGGTKIVVWKKSATSEIVAIRFLIMIIKKKNASILQSGTIFQNGTLEPFWLHFFF